MHVRYGAYLHFVLERKKTNKQVTGVALYDGQQITTPTLYLGAY